MEERLPTHLWVMAQVRRLSDQGIAVALLRRGEHSGGGVILKITQLAPGQEPVSRVLTQARDNGGALAWMAALSGKLVSEADATAYIERAIKRDPDLWVVEIEDREGRHHFEGKLLT